MPVVSRAATVNQIGVPVGSPVVSRLVLVVGDPGTGLHGPDDPGPDTTTYSLRSAAATAAQASCTWPTPAVADKPPGTGGGVVSGGGGER